MLNEPHHGSDPFETDYVRRFGLSARPFSLSPDPAFYFESKSHKEAVTGLHAFLSQGEPFALVFGDVGTGKTILSRHFLTSLDREGFDAGLIINPAMDEAELLAEARKRLGFGDMLTAGDPAACFQRVLLDASRSGKRHVLAIDEAQLLPDRVLQFLSDLLPFQAEGHVPLHVILIGQDEMVSRLLAGRMREVRRRITTTCRLQPLADEEVSPYIEHRLLVAGSRGTIRFTDDAVRLLYANSGGYPRILNTLCDRCLLRLSPRPGVPVDRKMVRQVIGGRA